MNAETIALILTPLGIAWGSWLTWLVSVRNNTQEDIELLLTQQTAEIDRLRTQLFERDRLAQETWTELLQLRRRVLDLEHQLHRLYQQAMMLYTQIVELGADPIVKPMNHKQKRETD